jgi:hypothetical protein
MSRPGRSDRGPINNCSFCSIESALNDQEALFGIGDYGRYRCAEIAGIKKWKWSQETRMPPEIVSAFGPEAHREFHRTLDGLDENYVSD